MLTRRHMIITGVLAPLALPLSASEIGDDGLHKQSWFTDSFLEMGDDLQNAADNGRGLMVLIEQAGCPYCKELHEVNFARPEITDYIQAHYDVIQLDLWGAREVTDFDGEVLEERDLARKWSVNFTPTTILFPASAAGALSERDAQAMRMPGYLKPFHYLSALEFVETGAYESENFQRYLQTKFDMLKEKGIDPDVW